MVKSPLKIRRSEPNAERGFLIPLTMYQPQPVKAAALFNCLSPQLFGKSFRFPKRLFQLYDSGFRRIGTGPLPRNRSTQVIR